MVFYIGACLSRSPPQGSFPALPCDDGQIFRPFSVALKNSTFSTLTGFLSPFSAVMMVLLAGRLSPVLKRGPPAENQLFEVSSLVLLPHPGGPWFFPSFSSPPRGAACNRPAGGLDPFCLGRSFFSSPIPSSFPRVVTLIVSLNAPPSPYAAVFARHFLGSAATQLTVQNPPPIFFF